jgi:ankyrin repeat protein
LVDKHAAIISGSLADDNEAMNAIIIGSKLLAKVMRLDFVGNLHVGAVVDMLHQKADPNFVDKEKDDTGGSILYHSAGKSQAPLIAKLLALGGNASKMNDSLDSPVLHAAYHRRSDVVEVLVSEDQSKWSGDADFAEEDLSEKLVTGMSEMSAADVRALATKGADINYKNNNGWTPLNSAVFFEKKESVDVLLRISATSHKRLNVDALNAKRRTALHIAARKGFDDIVVLLLNGRADTKCRDMDGWTPLHHAVFNCEDKCVEVLIQNDGPACLNIPGLRGFTPYLLHESPYTQRKLGQKRYCS